MTCGNIKDTNRFWSKVAIGEPYECWEWQAGKDCYNYGRIKVDGQMRLAPRIAWMLMFGAIPTGKCVCHRFDNPGCCNPYHLFLGTHAENMADMVNKGRSHRGGKHRSARITEDDVLEIRVLLKSDTQTKIGEMFGVSSQQINHISTGRAWGWLK